LILHHIITTTQVTTPHLTHYRQTPTQVTKSTKHY